MPFPFSVPANTAPALDPRRFGPRSLSMSQSTSPVTEFSANRRVVARKSGRMFRRPHSCRESKHRDRFDLQLCPRASASTIYV